ncbi:hypothetical protein RND81_01G160100 [Saponaria officinalis]|uniref:Secreted protein n=1 Tax=Saponaria officinalis TaxID=3572 RepID=A0AAW1NA90_SAPOF
MNIFSLPLLNLLTSFFPHRFTSLLLFYFSLLVSSVHCHPRSIFANHNNISIPSSILHALINTYCFGTFYHNFALIRSNFSRQIGIVFTFDY